MMTSMYNKNDYCTHARWISNDYSQLNAACLAGYPSCHIQPALME